MYASTFKIRNKNANKYFKSTQPHYFFKLMPVLVLCCFMGFSLVVVSGGYSLVAVHRLLIEGASLLVEHRL